MASSSRRQHGRIYLWLYRTQLSNKVVRVNWYDYLSVLLGVVGMAYGVRCYWELRKWAYLIKYGRIVIAYKNKVKLNAPLQEWALWCRTAEYDKSSNGRVVYSIGGTRVAILRQSFVPDTPVVRWFKVVKEKIAPRKTAANPQVREGTWTAEDHTEKVN